VPKSDARGSLGDDYLRFVEEWNEHRSIEMSEDVQDHVTQVQVEAAGQQEDDTYSYLRTADTYSYLRTAWFVCCSAWG
jgi:hypothetical protein